MSGTVIVRYTTHPEQAEENQRLIRAVFAELAERRPEGLRYVVTRLEDGVSFVHLATFDGDVNPLTTSSAFREFVSGIGDRCVVPPVSTEGTTVGRYPGPE
jgi:hypothetical protein